jgi:hypothetical protein
MCVYIYLNPQRSLKNLVTEIIWTPAFQPFQPAHMASRRTLRIEMYPVWDAERFYQCTHHNRRYKLVFYKLVFLKPPWIIGYCRFKYHLLLTIVLADINPIPLVVKHPQCMVPCMWFHPIFNQPFCGPFTNGHADSWIKKDGGMSLLCV